MTILSSNTFFIRATRHNLQWFVYSSSPGILQLSPVGGSCGNYFPRQLKAVQIVCCWCRFCLSQIDKSSRKSRQQQQRCTMFAASSALSESFLQQSERYLLCRHAEDLNIHFTRTLNPVTFTAIYYLRHKPQQHWRYKQYSGNTSALVSSHHVLCLSSCSFHLSLYTLSYFSQLHKII